MKQQVLIIQVFVIVVNVHTNWDYFGDHSASTLILIIKDNRVIEHLHLFLNISFIYFYLFI